MKVLEEDVEKSLQREESRLDAEEQSYPDDVQKALLELKSKHDVSGYPTRVCRFTDSGTFTRPKLSNYENARVRWK
jgi:hypothetical protein